MLRVFVIDFSVSAETLNSDECIESKISQAINDNNEIKAFILLVTNNLKGCVINILGEHYNEIVEILQKNTIF